MYRLRSDALAWREVDGEIIALDQRTAMYLGANETAAVVWKLLSVGATSEQMAAALVRAFEVDDETAHRDVAELIGGLEEQGLLESEQ